MLSRTCAGTGAHSSNPHADECGYVGTSLNLNRDLFAIIASCKSAQIVQINAVVDDSDGAVTEGELANVLVPAAKLDVVRGGGGQGHRVVGSGRAVRVLV